MSTLTARSFFCYPTTNKCFEFEKIALLKHNKILTAYGYTSYFSICKSRIVCFSFSLCRLGDLPNEEMKMNMSANEKKRLDRVFRYPIGKSIYFQHIAAP